MRIILGILYFIVVLFVLKLIFPKPATFLLVMFVIMSIAMGVASIIDHKEINAVKNDGVSVETTVTKIVVVEDRDDTEYNVSFAYKFEGETYTYIDHRGDKKYDVGDSVKAYIYPDKPQELYFDEAFSIGWSIFLLAMGVVVFFAGRGMSKKDWEELYIPD